MGCHASHWLSYFPRWLSHHQPVHLGNQRFMLHGTSLLIVLFTGVSYCRNHCDFVWWVSSNWSQKNYHETNICRIFAHQSQLIGHIKSYTCNYASAATCSNDIEAGLLFMGDFPVPCECASVYDNFRIPGAIPIFNRVLNGTDCDETWSWHVPWMSPEFEQWNMFQQRNVGSHYGLGITNLYSIFYMGAVRKSR